jgi:hypothetical protein
MRKIIVLVGFVGALIVVLFVRNSSAPNAFPSVVVTNKEGGVDVAATKATLAASMDKSGSARVWEALKQQMTGEAIDRAHTIAHMFGDLLWERDGIAGVAICDESFGFGCYHSLFGRAIAAIGPESIVTLEEACIAHHGEGGLGCVHGIGHGLGEYFGPARLTEQLDSCSKLHWQGAYFGCAGGVFMEYNFPALVGESETRLETRSMDSAPYEPCLSVATRFRRACMLEEPSWWLSQTASDYTKAGALCANVRDVTLKGDCFRGIGYTAGPGTGYNISETQKACGHMPSAEGTILCLAGASWSFFANPDERAYASDVCVRLDAQEEKHCIDASDLLAERPL